jgi:hypothetical protein
MQSDADSGLYVLASAKSIALNLGIIDLDSRTQSISLRWQLAEELLKRSLAPELKKRQQSQFLYTKTCTAA